MDSARDRSIAATARWNRELDADLERRGVVDAGLFAELEGAFSDDSASSMGWLEAKLRILVRRIADGHIVTLFHLRTGSWETTDDAQALRAWVDRYFPGTEP